MTVGLETRTGPPDDDTVTTGRSRRRLLGLLLLALLVTVGVAVGLWQLFGSSSKERPALAATFPHKTVLAQGTGDAVVRLPHRTGRVVVTLACRGSQKVTMRFLHEGRMEFGLSVGCGNGIGTDALAQRAPWPDTVRVSARGGEWVLWAGWADRFHLR